MTHHDTRSRKRNKLRIALDSKIIAGIWKACYPAGVEDALSVADLKRGLKKFAQESKETIEKKCKGFYSLWPKGEFKKKLIECAMSHDIENFGATLIIRNFLCCYAFEGRSWREALVYLGLKEEEQYRQHAVLKAALNATTPSFSAVIIEKKFKEKFPDVNPGIKTLTVDDLGILKRHAPLKVIFGNIQWKRIEERLGHNPDLIKGVISKKSVTGFFILYPLTKKCQALIETGRIKRSNDFEVGHLCKDFNSAPALYVSFVYAYKYKWSEANLFKKFREEMANILIENPKIKTVYTRPTTNDGRRLAINKFDFRAVEANKKVRYLKTKDFLWQL